MKVTKRKSIPFIFTGLFLTNILYTAKEAPAASTHRSPSEKRKEINLFKLPPDNRNRMPLMQINMPANFLVPSFSLRNIRARIIETIGEEVVPINARLIAGE